MRGNHHFWSLLYSIGSIVPTSLERERSPEACIIEMCTAGPPFIEGEYEQPRGGLLASNRAMQNMKNLRERAEGG
jgi:hypothetical protein